MKKLVVDFDNTLFHTYNFPEIGKHRFVNKFVASYVRYKKRKGWVIILNTLRESTKGLEEAVQACKAYDIPIDYVNENYPPDVEYWGESRKIGATLSIDDTQVGLIGWILRRLG
jgi:FMN phosphatase YigB (HAD superfamily)